MNTYYSHDITWCSKKNCTYTKCERNRKHIRPGRWEYSFADYEGTKCCPKRKGTD